MRSTKPNVGWLAWWVGGSEGVGTLPNKIIISVTTERLGTVIHSKVLPKKHSVIWFACRPGGLERGYRLPKEPVDDMLRPIIILSVVLLPSLDAMTLNKHTGDAQSQYIAFSASFIISLLPLSSINLGGRFTFQKVDQ